MRGHFLALAVLVCGLANLVSAVRHASHVATQFGDDSRYLSPHHKDDMYRFHPNEATRYTVTTSDDARCLDGTPPIYYLRKAATGSVNATKWYIHIQGGGWCVSLDDCASRAKTRLGSSKEEYNYPPTIDLRYIEGCNNSRWCGNLIVNDKGVNPMTYDWNGVFIVYCDGGSFTGNNATVTHYSGTDLYFRGYHNLQVIVDSLINEAGMKHATEVIVGGDSAGGLASWIHTDYFASKLPKGCRVAGLPDSGFFMDLGSGSYHDSLVWVYQQMNSTEGLHPDCVADMQSKGMPISNCIFAQHTAPYVRSRMFAQQGRFDSYQTDAILHSEDPAKVNPYGEQLVRALQQTVLSKKQNAAFVDSCHHHCGYWQGCIGQPIDGTYAEEAFQQFFYQRTDRQLWLQNQSFPCASCCADGPCAI